MVPDRHGPTAWKRWIFGLTDHLNLENIENRRWYHNSGKPRIAGLCGREVVASDHLPLSSTFFGRPKPPDLTRKTAALVPLPMLFSFWRYPRKTTSPTFAYTGPTRPTVSAASPDATSSAKASHSPSQAATCGSLAHGPDTRSQALYALLRGPAIILYCGAIFDGPAPRDPDPECDPEYRKSPWSG